MGRIALPSLVMQAASPSLGSLLIERLGSNDALGAVMCLALANVLLVVVLFGLMPKPTRPAIVPT
jgi:hypothetical protein